MLQNRVMVISDLTTNHSSESQQQTVVPLHGVELSMRKECSTSGKVGRFSA